MAFFLLFWGYYLTPTSIKLSGRFGILDQPSPRKAHSQPVPRGAGLVLWVGFLLWALLLAPDGREFSSLATGASMVFFVGYIDDMSPIRPIVRLIVHILAAALVVVPLHTSILSSVIYVLWIAGCTNAYNLIDGMNGLSLSMAMLAFFSIGWANDSFNLTVPLIALCLGVFPWNFPKAHTFLGDGGVYLLGFVVSTMVMWSVGVGLSLYPIKASMTLALLGGVPVLDTLITIARRLLSGKSPFSPDRGHIHHRLLDMGFPQGKVLFLLVLAQGLFLLTGFYFFLSF